MKTELIILAVLVVAALGWMLGCSIRLHCKGVDEKFGPNNEEECMTGCYNKYAKSIDRVMEQCAHEPGCPRLCVMNSSEWKQRNECYRSCVKQ